MTDFIQVATTIDDEDKAQTMARRLVELRLAACVQVLGPLTSTYHWQGSVESAQEWMCLAKTRAELYPKLEAAIKELHPYDVPEILATAVVDGNADYLDWIKTEAAIA